MRLSNVVLKSPDVGSRLSSVEVVQGSLVSGRERVLVNASNTNGQLGSGVSGAIRRACGEGFQEHILAALNARFGGPMAPGEVLVTEAGAHPTAKWVAHVAVMDYREGIHGGSFPDSQRIRAACVKLWETLEQLDEVDLSVAMVALGAGTGGLSLRESVDLACSTLSEHLSAREGSRLGRLVFYGYNLPEYIATVDIVSRYFALPEGSVSREVLDFVERCREQEQRGR
ncbi:macro domain-containing protein [Myxococcus sp. CA051A]|uniref:macro domain-containing protein n=1 Tax=Myxococcus sp. CA051A TaxID=2741739 RepID=UPI00157A96D4|nr:macro domain-containing protein [Myxococcus sp. CA051A]NTX63668.1 macro domain-containing protein [Myxococcus sp. CA051A]